MIRVVLGQLNFLVGDIEYNTQKMMTAAKKAQEELKADLIVFPELAITGYPPEDLLLRQDFLDKVQMAIQTLKDNIRDIDVVFGYPEKIQKTLCNSALWLRNGECVANYRKQKLPNYSVFDEIRYFTPGRAATTVPFKEHTFALLICEDIWHPEPMKMAKQSGAEFVLCLNGSPYSVHKIEERKKVIQKRVQETDLPIFYVNTVGGQDELVFDGGSHAMDKNTHLVAQAECFKECLLVIDIDEKGQIQPQPLPKELGKAQSIYEALKLGVRDYVEKNHFPGVLIGISGGIDSALTAAIATDALGPEKVTGVLMPSPYTSTLSMEEGEAICKNLHIQHLTIPISPIFDSFLENLTGPFHGLKPDVTEENLQARVRGTLLMALSNKTGRLVLTTGNKSEMATGYATLYGDMAGGFNVLKDVLKTSVYELARYRNQISPVIPPRTIDRAPTAELKHNQTDQDTLPPYDVLDQILKYFVEENESAETIITKGFDAKIVHRVIRMVLKNEYKRRQSAPGIRITEKAFGKDRRYPITSGFNEKL